MRIAVCIKQVPEHNDVLLDPVTHTIIREGTASIVNPFDSYAIEEAVRLKEAKGAHLIALSMGIPSAKRVIKEAVSLGVDEGYLLSDRAFAGSDTLATAYTLAAAIRKLGEIDLILCGKMASDGDTAQVGPMIAEELSIPHVTNVSKIERIDNQRITCVQMTDTGYQRLEVILPALLTVVKEINIPRLPSVQGYLHADQYEVPVISEADLTLDKTRLGLHGSPTKVIKTHIPIPNKDCHWLDADDPNSIHELLTIVGKTV